MAGVSFDQLDGKIWFNGEFVNWADAKVHVLTHGLHYASSVFEGERAYNGEIFKLREHTERLFYSAETLGMEMPYTIEEIDRASMAALEVQGLKDAYIRPAPFSDVKADTLEPFFRCEITWPVPNRDGDIDTI